MSRMQPATAYHRPGPAIVAGEPGKSGLHGEWLFVAKALADGAGTRREVAAYLIDTNTSVNRALDQMIAAHIVRIDGDHIWLSEKGLKRLDQAEANGR